MSLSFAILGAGNLAVNLGMNLKRQGFEIKQVYSRTMDSARGLAEKLDAGYTIDPGEIREADIYVVALSDSAVAQILSRVHFNNRLVIHCSGSLPMSVLKDHSANIGVFYPLQTFSKQKILDFRNIPVFIEANSVQNENMLIKLAGKLTDSVHVMNSADRIFLHISAVFSCNFVNHLFTISSEILKTRGIAFNILRPLIQETSEKVQGFEPRDSQTGPAVRSDMNVINSHLEELRQFPEYADMYRMISESISKYYQNK